MQLKEGKVKGGRTWESRKHTLNLSAMDATIIKILSDKSKETAFEML
jgi:hypothetical protein